MHSSIQCLIVHLLSFPVSNYLLREKGACEVPVGDGFVMYPKAVVTTLERSVSGSRVFYC